METVDFVGLGSMGLPMAKNLLAGGFAVRGFDVSPAALDALVAAGGTRAESVAKAFADASVAALMVVNSAQAEQVLFADGGVAAMPAGGIVVLMATCSPRSVETIAARAFSKPAVASSMLRSPAASWAPRAPRVGWREPAKPRCPRSAPVQAPWQRRSS